MANDDNGKPEKKKKAHDKPTTAELEHRISVVQGMLVQGAQKHVIKQACYRQWGVGFRTVERYLARARDAIIEEQDIPKTEATGLLAAFLRFVMGAQAASYRDRLQAAKQLADLFALNGPIKIAETDAEGNGLTPAQRKAHYEAILAERFGQDWKIRLSGDGNGEPSTDG